MTLQVNDARREPRPDGTTELSASINGERLWFRLPHDRAGALRGEPFACCAIVPAMARGETMELAPELPISAEFLAGLERYMDILRFWTGYFKLPLRRVEIHARIEPAPPGIGRGTLFSGGVDGMHTFLGNRDVIDHGVFVHGVDFQLDNPVADIAASRNREWLAARNSGLLEIGSNMRWVGQRLGIRWNSHNGACLTGCAHALGLERIYIASGHSWLCCLPGGTHPVTDPLLGGDALKVMHHGNGWMRWQKLLKIAKEPGALDLLRVCWQDNGYNCGECEKCRLTIFLLMTLGLEASEFRFPDDVRSLWPGPIRSSDDYFYMLQHLALARNLGDEELIPFVEKRLNRHRWRKTFKELDQGFTGGSLLKTSRLGRTMLRKTIG